MNYLKLTILMSTGALTGFGQTSATWYEIPSGTDVDLNVVEFASASVGYIGADDSLLLKTTDYGATWTAVDHSGITFYPGGEDIVNIDFVSPAVGYLATGPYGSVYKTTDGGLNWTEIVVMSQCFVTGLYMTADGEGFTGGSGCFSGEQINKLTADVPSGTTVNFPGLAASEMVVAIDFLNDDFGLAASSGGRILRTSDGGATWDTIPSSLGNTVPLTSIEIVNDTLAYAGYDDTGSGFGLLRSTDGGLSWDMDMASATFYYPAFHCVHEGNNGIIYSGASNGMASIIFESLSVDWWPLVEVDHPIHSMTSSYGNVVWGVGDSGYVVVNQEPGQLGMASEIEIGDIIVFPNPAIDVLNIELPEKLEGTVSEILLTDMAGKVVLRSKETSSISIEGLFSGVYLITVKTEATSMTARFIVE
jgi:hypothetical protein